MGGVPGVPLAFPPALLDAWSMPGPRLDIADFVADPDGTLREARQAGPIAESETGPMFVQHHAVRALVQSDQLRPSFSAFLRQFGITSGPFYEWMAMSPLDMEGEAHRRWRQVMARTFTPRSVERLRPFLREEADRLVQAFLPSGRCEFMEAFARQLPSLGLCELIGVPREDRATFSGWADTIGLGFNLLLLPTRIGDVDVALTELLDYAQGLVARRRADPQDDLVSRLALAAAEDDGIPADRVHGSVAGLVFAGHETTKNQLGWMMVVLSAVPEEWDRVAREPERATEVIEEVLRFRSAVTSVGRLALEDVELFGRPIAKGTSVVGSLWSANRDAQEFGNPDAFDVDANRDGVQMAFGSGAHHCLGAALARAELQESLVALSRKMTCPRLEPGAEYLPPVGINGPVTLPIAFTAR
jgi:cytochrome P450